MVRARSVLVALLATSLAGAACASDDGASDEEAEAIDQKGEKTRQRKDDILIERADLDGDGTPDVVTRYETWTDEDDPDLTRKRLVQKTIDVNTDGNADIVRKYDDQGKLESERSDTDLDGTLDTIGYYDQEGNLLRKEVFDDSGENVRKTRFYAGGDIDRIETDMDGDGDVERWEYYDGGELQRIGRDKNSDGEIDSWVQRRREAAKTADPEAETSPEPGTGGGEPPASEGSSEE